MAKQIISLASSDDRLALSRAMFAAKYGRPLSKAELELLDFLSYSEELKMIQKRKRKPVSPQMLSPDQLKREEMWEEGIERGVKLFGDKIAEIFLKAVQEYDAEKIIELARAVWFFKDELSSNFIHVDAEHFTPAERSTSTERTKTNDPPGGGTAGARKSRNACRRLFGS